MLEGTNVFEQKKKKKNHEYPTLETTILNP